MLLLLSYLFSFSYFSAARAFYDALLLARCVLYLLFVVFKYLINLYEISSIYADAFYKRNIKRGCHRMGGEYRRQSSPEAREITFVLVPEVRNVPRCAPRAPGA